MTASDGAVGGLLAQWRLLGAATKDARLSRSDLAVFHAVADRIGDNGTAWPSVRRIAFDVGADKRTVTRSIKRLCSAGYLVRQSGNRTNSNVYRLGMGEPAPRGESTGRGEVVAGYGRTRPLGMGEPAPVIHPLNPPNEGAHKKTRTRGARAALPDPPAWVPREAWDGYVEMRKRKRATLTPRACELIFKKLGAFRANGHAPGDVLDKSTAAGWTDVYEPRIDQVRTGQHSKTRSAVQTLLGGTSAFGAYGNQSKTRGAIETLQAMKQGKGGPEAIHHRNHAVAEEWITKSDDMDQPFGNMHRDDAIDGSAVRIAVADGEAGAEGVGS